MRPHFRIERIKHLKNPDATEEDIQEYKKWRKIYEDAVPEYRNERMSISEFFEIIRRMNEAGNKLKGGYWLRTPPDETPFRN